MKKLKLIIIIFTLSSCNMLTNHDEVLKTKKDTICKKEVKMENVEKVNEIKDSIVGFALNEKAGAIVRNNQGVFFIGKTEPWSNEYLNKEVLVIGVIRPTYKEKDTSLNDDDIYCIAVRQEYQVEFTISDATWMLYSAVRSEAQNGFRK